MFKSSPFFFQIFNAEVLFRDDCTADQFIDVIMGNRVYLNCLYVYNKIDQVSLEEVDRLANLPYSVVISCYMKLNLGKDKNAKMFVLFFCIRERPLMTSDDFR